VHRCWGAAANTGPCTLYRHLGAPDALDIYCAVGMRSSRRGSQFRSEGEAWRGCVAPPQVRHPTHTRIRAADVHRPFFFIHTFHLMLVRSRRAHDISPHMFKLSSFFNPTRRTDGCSPSCGSSAASFCDRSFSPANPHVSCGGGGAERAALGCGCTPVASKGHQPPLGDGCRCGAATGLGSAGARPPRAGEGGAAYIRKPRPYHTVSLTDTLCLTTLGIPCLGGPFPFASHPLP